MPAAVELYGRIQPKRGTVKLDPFQERNLVLFQGNDKHTTATSFWSGRFMFPLSSPGAIVPVVTQPVAGPFAADSERQATIRELMPYFLGYGKVELRWAAGTLEKYEDAMGWVIRWLGDIAPGRITKHHILLIKAECAKRNVGPNRIAHILAALKAFLRFCQMAVGIETMDVREIHFPRIPQARGAVPHTRRDPAICGGHPGPHRAAVGRHEVAML
jgi:hypothetical protein